LIFRWLTFIFILLNSYQAIAVKLESETLPFDIRAASMRFSQVTGNHGLDITNRSIITDDQGYLWIGTQSGLIRLDGYQSKRYLSNSKSRNALISNYIYSLAFQASSSRIWIGTSNGLSVLDLKQQRFHSYQKADQFYSLTSNIIQSILIDSKERVWLGTKDGLNLYQPESDTFKQFLFDPLDKNSLSHNNVLDIKEDHLGNLWVATQVGLSRYIEGVGFERHNPLKKQEGSQGLITKIAVDSENSLWLGTEQHGVVYYNPSTSATKLFSKRSDGKGLPSNYVQALLFDKKGELWIGTTGGLTIYTPKNGEYFNFSNEHVSSNIVSLFQDQNDIIWIGTWSKGMVKFNPRATQVGQLSLKTLQTQGDTIISLVKGVGNDIWVANPKHLYQLLPEKNKIEKYNILKLNPNNSRAIPFVDHLKQQFFLLTDKIHRVTDTDNIRSFSLPKEIQNASWYSASFDSKGQLWLGGRNVGVYILSEDFKSILHHIPSALAGYINQIDSSTMLVGSFSATFWVDIESFETLTHSPNDTLGMLHPSVTGYHETSDGRRWLGTSAGIHQLNVDKNGTEFYRTWTQQEGLPTDVLTGPLEDSSGKLWFSSTDGLIRFDPNNDSIEHFDGAQGALNIYYIAQYLKDDSQRLFFLGPKGVSIIDERFVRRNQTPYPIVIDEFRVMNEVQLPFEGASNILQKSIQYSDSILLPPEKRDFSFSFSSTYFSQPSKVKYFYRLSGFDEQWQQIDSKYRQLKYTNLNPGRYRLEIYSLSSYGAKSDIKTVDLRLLPFYYETLWFKVLLGLFFLSIFLIWYKYRMYKIKQYNQQLEVEVRQRTQDIRMLAKIGRDISSLLDIHELFEHLYIHLNKSLDVSVLAIGVYEKDNQRIKFERSLENGEIMPTHYRPMNSETELAAWCIENNQEMIMNEHSERFNFIKKNSGPIVGESMQTVIYIPIISRTNEMLGCITIQSKQKNAYDDEDLEFIRTISNYTGIALDNTLAHSELKKVSSTDFLTGLTNRRAFVEQANFQAGIFKRCEQPLSFAMADIDHFKIFNDQHGHDCGDHVLQKVAKIFKQATREQDLVSRWGGEEFIFMFPNTAAQGALIILNKLRKLLEETDFEFQGRTLKITATFGACQFASKEELEDVINRADAALYQGKNNGRNCVEIISTSEPS
jgi:diguanylate cyclase (GGDEF)-like protein